MPVGIINNRQDCNMDVEDSTQATPAASAWRQWLENLVTGLRLALFCQPAPFQFHVSANHVIAIAATCLGLNGVCAFALAGFGGAFNLHALPSAVFWVTLTLFAGYLSGQVMKDRRYVLLIPIVVGSIGIPLSIASNVIWYLADSQGVSPPAVFGLLGIDEIIVAWWTLATLRGDQTTHAIAAGQDGFTRRNRCDHRAGAGLPPAPGAIVGGGDSIRASKQAYPASVSVDSARARSTRSMNS